MVDLLGEEIAELRYYYWTRGQIAGAPVVITRTGWTSEVGYEVYLTDTSRGTEVYDEIMEAGTRDGLRPTGPSDIRRIEGAIFNWGADMTYENNAFELGLERLIDFDLDDSAAISIAAYRRIRQQGVSNKINGVVSRASRSQASTTPNGRFRWPAGLSARSPLPSTRRGSPPTLVMPGCRSGSPSRVKRSRRKRNGAFAKPQSRRCPSWTRKKRSLCPDHSRPSAAAQTEAARTPLDSPATNP